MFGKPAYRRVFISDTHVGHPRAKTAELLDFLNGCPADAELYLLGDILDDLVLTLHPQVADTSGVAKIKTALETMAQTRSVIRLAGNHDLAPLALPGVVLSGAPYRLDDATVLVHGHGEEWFWRVGHYMVDPVRHKLKGKLPVRGAVKNAALLTRAVAGSGFYRRLANTARKHQVTTIVHGHVHAPGVRRLKNLQLICLPDWLDSSGGALVEYADGRRALVDAKHQLVSWVGDENLQKSPA